MGFAGCICKHLQCWPAPTITAILGTSPCNSATIHYNREAASLPFPEGFASTGQELLRVAPVRAPTGQRPHILYFVPQPQCQGQPLSKCVQNPGVTETGWGIRACVYIPPEPPISYVTSGVTCSHEVYVPSCEMRVSTLLCLRVPSSFIFSTSRKALSHPSIPPSLPSLFLPSFNQPTHISYHVPDSMPEAAKSGQAKKRGLMCLLIYWCCKYVRIFCSNLETCASTYTLIMQFLLFLMTHVGKVKEDPVGLNS